MNLPAGGGMRRLKLYLDTTVWNFYFDDRVPVYQEAAVEFFAKARLGLYDLNASAAVAEELDAAPEPKRGKLLALFEEISPNLLEADAEVKRLAALYLDRRALPARSTLDALHVAHATLHQMDVLVSFNFKHLANIGRRDRITAINLEQGYSHPLNLLPPMQLPEVENGES
jgi:hypothetical protein